MKMMKNNEEQKKSVIKLTVEVNWAGDGNLGIN
jgi:hypothetical protein